MRIAVTLSFLLFAASLAAAPAEIDRAAAAMAGQEASFTQRFTPRGFKNAQVESGSVVFGSLPMMRWSYRSPEEKIFVFDGSRSWLYIPADHQVTVGAIDAAHRRELPFLMLDDPADRDRFFTLREQARGTDIVTSLQPRDADAAVRDITVVTGPDHRIVRVDYSDREGNHTSFEFSGYHPHSGGAETFRFQPPPGTKVVDGP